MTPTHPAHIQDRATQGQIDLLLGYMPIIVRASGISEWERTFCASIISRSRTARFRPTERQINTMRVIVQRFQDRMRDDAPLTEDDHGNG